MPAANADFNIEGYDVVAHGSTLESGGDVAVLNNNSTHYIVVLRLMDGIGNLGQYRRVESFEYNDGIVGVETAYRRALYRMVQVALDN